MKLTCRYRPSTTTHRADGACSRATAASEEGMPVSTSGATT